MTLRLAVMLLLLPCALLAKGGVYIDDVKITNDGVVVFSDSFNGGDLKNWTALRDATAPCDKDPASCCLHLNNHGTGLPNATHTLAMKEAGVVEVSWRQWVAPAEEQAGHERTVVGVMMGIVGEKTGRSIVASTCLYVGDKEPCLSVDVDGKTGKLSELNVPTGKWVRMLVRMDSATSKVTFSADGKVGVEETYDPKSLLPAKQLTFQSGLGDGIKPGS